MVCAFIHLHSSDPTDIVYTAMTHIEPSKLFGAVEGRLDDKEGRHLEECQDCRRAVFQTHIDEDGRERRTDSGMRLVRRFMQGDSVCVIGPIAPDYPGSGIVRAVTFAGNVYRYVVQFEDGTLDTFFGLQLRQA